MTYKVRYILTIALLLMVGKAVAQVTVKGSVFGGGNKADVQVNTIVNIGGGQVEGNVYGGGNLGDVGKINDKSDKANYTWTGTDNQPNSSGGANNTGVSSVHITGSTALIGLSGDNVTANRYHGNVFGGGKGDDNSGFYCEKGMVYSTSVEITAGTVKGTVFGGGEVGRVEDNTIVTIGVPGASREGEEDPSTPVINGDVFGAGKGLKTHGYSALVRGNPVVTVQGKTLVGGSVYGGGEIASVGKHKVKTSNSPLTPDDAPADLPVGMPYTLANTNLGKCTVTIKDNVIISNNVFGAGQGFGDYSYDSNNKPQRMGMADMETLESEDLYHVFLQTLALATDTHVTIDGNANVNGSVFGGSESGFVQYDTNVTIKGGTVGVDVYGGGRGLTNNTIAGRVNENINVNILGGTITRDVYGGAALAQSNTKSTTTSTVNLLGGTIGRDAYGGGLGDANTAANVGNTKVNLNGMAISEYNANTTLFSSYVNPIDNDDPANGTDYYMVNTSNKGCIVNRIFGANNVNGTPLGDVTVHVYATQNSHTSKTNVGAKMMKDDVSLNKGDSESDADYLARLKAILRDKKVIASAFNDITVSSYDDTFFAGTDASTFKTAIETLTTALDAKAATEAGLTAMNAVRYDVEAVYGGGNEAAYVPTTPYLPTEAPTGSKTQVIIDGCDYTSIEYVYGGGNAAAVPETNVTVNAAYEIYNVFGGGNGRDNLSSGAANPGADVGVYKNASNQEVTYGTGNATTRLIGGTVYEAYGASNTKGNIKGTVDIDTGSGGCCTLNVEKMVGAGKNADIDGDVNLVLGCKPASKIAEIYGGADNANVNGSVSLTVTSGNYGKVFGGNNLGGIIKGSITLNIEETGECDTPINIDELYLGGNQAAYSVYGYKEVSGVLVPRSSLDDGTLAYDEPTSHPTGQLYADPVLNVISCTSIGQVFGGGLGEKAVMYGNPTVNINMIPGSKAALIDRDKNGTPDDPTGKLLGTIRDVFGGGNQAAVIGNTTVNIGTATTVTLTSVDDDPDTNNVDEKHPAVEGAYITGNVYGGGNKADVTGNTFVNVCAVKSGNSYAPVAEGTAKVNIAGDVYGGGRGLADTFKCEKAMVGTDGAGVDTEHYPNYSDGNTSIVIGNGTVNGSVYGGGEIGRVEMNTSVTVGLGDGVASGGTVTSSPEIKHSVFGGGKGLETHGYSALVRGNPTVIIQGNAKVRDNVYGGGQIASVARYNVAQSDDEGAPYGVKKDMPYALKTNDSGFCTVTVRGYAEIGPATIASEAKTTDVGHVFGAGKGIVPGGTYAFVSETTKRMSNVNGPNTWETFATEADYITFVKTLALSSQTNVTIGGNAKVKGSVFGGSESGFVQFDTNVTVTGGTIGTQGKGGADFGNVYGGGKGDAEHTGVNVTYVDAGLVKGDTKVKIENGTVLHNVYGGGAYGTVGEFVYDTNGIPTGRRTYTVGTTVHNTTGGNTEVYVTGGTIGTTGSENGMIFGSSRGDVGAPGEIHDKLAWVYDTHVAIGDTTENATVTTSTPLIKGSVYGGGENGHNLHNAYVRINGGTIGIASGEQIGTYSGAAYPYRGNVYGGGCGTDKYWADRTKETNKGDGDTYNSLAGIVQGNAIIHITAGTVVHNVYGAGAMGSVGKVTKETANDVETITIPSGGKTTIAISGGTVGVDGSVGDGNVFGAARGDKATTEKDLALVKETGVTISGSTSTTQIKGSVYGGGEVGNVHTNTRVNVEGGAIAKNVFGGGKGVDDLFTCEQAMVGVEGSGAGAELTTVENRDKGTIVTISNGTVGTLEGEEGAQTLKEGTGNVYGGGEIGRVEWNTQVKIGVGEGTGPFEPVIYGNVFGAGKGLATHGYSALVRGNSTVTVQGGAKVEHNVYGGGEKSTVGRYWVKGINNNVDGAPEAPEDLPIGMPYKQQSGGICKVTVQGSAQVGPDAGASANAGHVYGAGKGVSLPFVESGEGKSQKMTNTNEMVDFTNNETTGQTAEESYLEFLQTLSLVTNSYVTIDGSAQVKGSVFGGSESGFVQHDTNVSVNNGTIGTTASYGNVFGGGRGLLTFAEAGKVKGNTTVTISNGTMYGNVYGGGNLGDVGIIDKTDRDNVTGQLTYNYAWKQTDGTTANTSHNNGITGDTDNTGICTVSITGGTIGINGVDDPAHGNVFGAGKGSSTTWWCEKAIVYATKVSVSGSTVVNGTVYGGGEVGRVEDDGKVTIGTANETESGSKPDIKGDVFGAGAGLATHGYSALLRGNTEVTVQGFAKIGGNVYGGGETASVGRFRVDKGLPKEPQSGGYCTVTIQDNAKIGSSGTENNVYGACKGVNPATISASDRKSMQLVNNKPEGAKGTTWDEYEDEDGNKDERFIWRLYTEAEYPAFLRTLALTSHPHVTIDEDATVYGSVYGGGERGITLGNVDVDITGGTVEQDVYGGGALADTNTGNWDEDDYVEADVSEGDPVTDLYERSGAGTNDSPYVYTATTDATAVNGKTYYSKGKWADANLTTGKYKTTVNLTGGLIKGDAYGGGLGQKTGFNSATGDIPAVVWGDINVYLGGDENGATDDLTATTAFDINYDTTTDPLLDDNGVPVAGQYVKVVKSGRVFGCNNLWGSPQGNVTVTVYKTREGNTGRTPENKKNSTTDSDHSYEVAAVYGGGNLAPYTTTGKKAHVIIDGCEKASILTVYGGGNAAPVPETDLDINGTYEIGAAFGGGNGKDKYKKGNTWQENSGADVNGDATTVIYGGTVHEAYGGSNEKGTISGNVSIDIQEVANGCPLDVGQLVGAGKNADVNGDLILVMGCKPNAFIPLVFAGADNANVNGDVKLTITSGNFGKVIGGNNSGGVIMGQIQLNIEETDNCTTPITIQDLYLGGYNAAYSMYGYYNAGSNDAPDYKPRTLEMTDEASENYKPAITTIAGSSARKAVPYAQPELNIISCTSIGRVFGGGYGEDAAMYADPVVNINMIPGSKATLIDRDGNGQQDNNAHYLGEIGGGYSYFDETENKTIQVEGGVFGGGNQATVYGNTTVNIGTETEVKMNTLPYYLESDEANYTDAEGGGYIVPVQGANIVGNVYGGGNLANVTGNTYVNICAKEADDVTTTNVIEYKPVTISGTDYEGVKITGNVFGGGKGVTDSFTCAKAMVGEVDANDGSITITQEVTSDGTSKGTRVSIGNGTVDGTVYGGGQIGRVEWNGVVTIGLRTESGETSAPVITGNVFGAGKGVEQYGYAALLRGNTFVTVQANAKIGKSVYGGGEIASVGKYNIVKAADLTDEFKEAHPELGLGMPWSLANQGSGYCNVTVRGNAEIGPNDMQMKKVDEHGDPLPPDDEGHVFGAGKGVLPYENKNDFECQTHKTDGVGQKHPGRMAPPADGYPNGKWECYEDDEEAYLTFIETQALATQTEVNIGGNAFVKGSVYGGSLSGHVQHGTHVTIADDCQIGAGFDIATGKSLAKYTNWPTETESITTSWKECAHWEYDANSGASYDPYAKYQRDGKYYYYDSNITTYHNTADGKDYADAAFTKPVYAEGASNIGKDGHTYYGNVFGGGSGVIPYAPGKWHRAAGSIGGNTVVDITGGHILTSVYGGNEHTDVGTYTKNDNGALVVPVRGGKCTINMVGGTLGVPRTETDMKAHPVTCYLFGAGKGDQRIFFNTWTNVISTEVNIGGSARIYGSTFGGGEDGHVINNAVTNIGGTVTIGETNRTYQNVIIGTTGTSYVDGNIFGGGRGFSGDAQTAGTIGGNVEVNIKNGKILGSIYGGGRLASVGTQFTAPDDPNYGNFLEDETGANAKTYGHVTVNISGGTIGNNGTNINVKGDADGKIVSGNVFGGSMGRLTLLDGTTNPIWPRMAQVKTTAVNISGTAHIKRNVYGGGEYGTVRNNAYVTIGGTKTADANANGVVTIAKDNNCTAIVGRDVYGGGYGSEDYTTKTLITVKEPKSNATPPYSADDYIENKYLFTPMIFAGCVGQNTYVNIVGGRVKKSVYGGGEMASVGIIDSSVKIDNSADDDDIVYTEGTGATAQNYVYQHNHKHNETNNSFALSWPYEFNYTPDFEGATHVKVTGGRVGLNSEEDQDNPFEDKDNGDVYGGGKGVAGNYTDYVFCANVGSAEVTIDYPTNNTAAPATYMTSADIECIAGAVYGGAENGHVMGDTKLTLNNGLIGHSMYGGGSGKGQFTTQLTKIPSDRVKVVTNNATNPAATPPASDGNKYTAKIYSITAGKVFGNTEVIMNGGYVVRNVYGGGNLGSVGKGNYSGGADDYSTSGYGETLTGNLWDGEDDANGHKYSAAFLNSGKSTVKIYGGNVGYIDFTKVSDYTYSNLPYGNVFGGCRGESAPNILESPRYLYCPTFFSGYVNETDVIIGDPDKINTQGYTGPVIAGSVYGGGMDGHVRRDATVTINSGTIGRAYSGDGTDLNNIEWLHCGNVYGAGSGAGQYQYDFNYDGDYEDEVEYTNMNNKKSTLKERDFSNSAGSVTRFTTVNINGGTIYRNVYGGGSLSSVGAPKIPPTRTDDPIRRNDDETDTQGKQSLNQVIVGGKTYSDTYPRPRIGMTNTAGYGGNVYGASRGDVNLGNTYSTAIWTQVHIKNGANIIGNVFGGGDSGMVKHDSDVIIGDPTPAP